MKDEIILIVEVENSRFFKTRLYTRCLGFSDDELKILLHSLAGKTLNDRRRSEKNIFLTSYK